MTDTLNLTSGASLTINGNPFVVGADVRLGGLSVHVVRSAGVGGTQWLTSGHKDVPDTLWRVASISGGPDVFGSSIGKSQLTFSGHNLELKASGSNWYYYTDGEVHLLLFKQGGRWNGKRGELITSIS